MILPSKSLVVSRRLLSGGRALFVGKAKKSSPSAYSATVLLPKTSFPSRIEGPARIDKDRQVVSSHEFQSLYQRQRLRSLEEGEREFVLHDGPPYANGALHLGHAVNKILKDVANRWKLANGYRVHYQPGWDCHGLPIELKVRSNSQANSEKLTPLQVRQEARKFALATVKSQREEFMSWGIMADWENPYLTMTPEYVKNELRQFHSLLKKGHVFRRYMPVYWSPVSKTALAESELEYNPAHKSTAIYVRFQLTEESVSKLLGSACQDRVFLLVWTTTPWSLVGNKAICYNPTVSYSVIRHGNDFYVVATDLLGTSKDMEEMFGADLASIQHFPGSRLERCNYHHPMAELLHCQDVSFPVLPGSHVAQAVGTGLVHTAPSHGQDDYLVGVEQGLDLSCPVDEAGCYVRGICNGDPLAGLPVLNEGTQKVLEVLHSKDHILKQSEFVHSYPYDWRSKTPVILRGSKQWFIDVASLQNAALESLSGVRIQPESAKTGFQGVLEKRPYWCISRQRVWGSPIPVFYDKVDGAPLINDRLVERLCTLIDQHGTDFWWTLNDDEILRGTGINPDAVSKGGDILDVWFDSGISWSSLGIQRQTDLYLEGLDQFSGWFYSSLMTSIALTGKAPYKNIFVHGFTMDEKGRKMSKSLGNVISPKMITEGGEGGKTVKNSSSKVVYGVDMLRFWISAHASQTPSVLVGESILAQSKQDLDRLRLIYKFLLGNISTVESRDQLLPYDKLLPLDRYVLHCLAEYCGDVSGSYEEMQFNKVCLRMQKFISSTLSSFYFHRIKDRLYCDSPCSVGRRSAVTALWHILEGLNYSVSPITPILSSELREANKGVGDPFEGDFQFRHWFDGGTDLTFMKLFAMHDKMLSRTSNETLKNSELSIFPKTDEVLSLLKQFDQGQLAEIWQVAKVNCLSSYDISGDVTVDEEDFALTITPSSEYCCPRCRLQISQKPDTLCCRCESVVKGP